MTNRRDDRRFCPCGTRLARDNSGKLCMTCRKTVSSHLLQRPLVPRSFWRSTELHEALEIWHIGHAIRAYRLHEFHPEPIPQATVANWLGMTQAQLSRIENGPPVTDLARLIPWAMALGIPEELLWFKLPKDLAGRPDPQIVTPAAPVMAQICTSKDAARHNTTAQRASIGSDREEMNMRRRALLLEGILAGTALSAAADGDLAQIEQLRRELDMLLDGSEIGRATIERWEAVPSEYSSRFETAAPRQLLIQVAGDFVELQHLLGRQHTTKDRTALTRISGQLAMLVGVFLAAMGDLRNAEAWYHTAGLAAREAQDRQLRGLVLARSAATSLYYGTPQRSVIKLTKAQTLLGRNATPERVFALVLQSRALAKLGRGDEAQRSLGEAETTFQDMPASGLGDPVFGYTERQFHFAIGNAYTHLGMAGDADAMQRQALDMYQPTEYRPRALIQLDQAHCMVSRGDVASACEYAQSTITAVPAAHQGLVIHWAREFLELLPKTSRDVAPARELRELLTTAS